MRHEGMERWSPGQFRGPHRHGSPCYAAEGYFPELQVTDPSLWPNSCEFPMTTEQSQWFVTVEGRMAGLWLIPYEPLWAGAPLEAMGMG